MGVIKDKCGNLFSPENTLPIENGSVIGQAWTIRAGEDVLIRPASFIVGRYFKAALFSQPGERYKQHGDLWKQHPEGRRQRKLD